MVRDRLSNAWSGGRLGDSFRTVSSETRLLQPSLVCPVADHFLAIDHTHPVAALFSPDGSVLSTVTWKGLVRQPSARKVWPYRSAVSNLVDTVWITEHSTEQTVQVHLTTGGVSVAPGGPRATEKRDVHRNRYMRVGRFAAGPLGSEVEIRTDTEGYACRSNVFFGSEGSAQPREVASLGQGSVVDFASSGSGFAVCLRVADKRPWSFNPEHEMFTGTVHESVTSVRVPQVDITDACWSRNGEVATEQALAEHMPYVLSECNALSRARMDKISVSVLDVDSIPYLETRFRSPAQDNQYVRLDCPFDEIGTPTGGLSYLGVFFEEDINAGLLDVITSGYPETYV